MGLRSKSILAGLWLDFEMMDELSYMILHQHLEIKSISNNCQRESCFGCFWTKTYIAMGGQHQVRSSS